MATTKQHTPTRHDAEAVLPLASALRLAVARMARRLRQQAEPGVTPSMLSALSTIERHGQMTLSELAAHERVTPPTVTTVVGRLEGAGLVVRQTDAADKRVTRISLSPEGRRFVEASRSRKTAYLAKRLGRLDPEELVALERAVEILERVLEEDAR